MGQAVFAARAMLHYFEEPIISGTRGSGTVFFSGCPLRCCFCQNYPISHGGMGKEISVERLTEIYKELQGQGAHNINLVNPTHFSCAILESLERSRGDITIPFVWNSSGYERVETLKCFEGHIQVYLPDLKYMSPALSALYSGARDYFDYAGKAILEMYRQVGPVCLNAEGVIEKGLIIRHLVLPNATHDSIKLLYWMKENLPDDITISLMGQYTPFPDHKLPKGLQRKLTSREYGLVVETLYKLGFKYGFIQDLESASTSYTPQFDLTGV
jgi:putative pyruvate formate lyase activating enzyme